MGGSQNLLPEFYMTLVTIWLLGEWLSQQMILGVCVSQILYTVSVAGGQALRMKDGGYETLAHTEEIDRVGTCRYSFAEQLVYHIQTWLAAVFIGWLYLLFMGYDLDTSIVIGLLILYRLMDSFVEILEIEFKLQDKIELEKQALLNRKIFPLIVYTIVLMIERDLVWACLVATLVKIPYIIFLDILPAVKNLVLDWRIKRQNLCQLRRDALPYWIIEFVMVYTLCVGRVILGIHSGNLYLVRYQELFLLSQTIFWIGMLLIQTPLEKIGNLCYQSSHRKHLQYQIILKHVGKIILRLVGLVVFICLVFCIKGLVITDVLYGTRVYPSSSLFCLLSLGTAISLLSYVMLKILVWMEQQSIVWIFVVSGIVTLVLNYYLFDEQGMYGIALAFVLSEAVQLIGLSIQFLLKFLKNNKKIQ
jgi:hypothetical protein